MSYLVLARKFRPQTFASIAGQEYISRALANAILRNRVSHAYLFTGPRGVGKTTSARVLARALNCTGRPLPSPEEAAALPPGASLEAVEPCGECTNCVEIARGTSIAVWEIDGASNNSVDNVRELIDSLRSLPPPGSNYKIYIIDEVHMLSVAAFNALLKSLEEPPPQTIFIFATTEPHKIPETVISRCQRHDFRRIAQPVIVERINEIAASESLSLEPGVAEFIARRAQGGMRDAQSMLDRLIALGTEKIELDTARQAFGSVDSGFFFEQSAAVLSGNVAECYAQLDKAFSQSLDIRSFAADFLAHWRGILLCATLAEADGGKKSTLGDQRLGEILSASPNELAQLREQTASLSGFDAQRLFDIAEKAAGQVLRSSFPRYVLEAALAKMATLPTLRPLPEIIEALKGANGQESGRRTQAAPGFVAPGFIARGPAAASTSPAATGSAQPQPARPVAKPPAEAVIDAASAPGDYDDAEDFEAEPAAGAFNPSWEGFLAHVKSNDAVMLGAYLRRVSATKFTPGVLQVAASKFDAASLQDKNTMKQLRDLLASFIPGQTWDIRISEHRGESAAAQGAPAAAVESAAGRRPVVTKRVVDSVVPGSIAERELQEKKRRERVVEKEARDSAITALQAFAGSSIEKIVVLDERDKK